MAVKIALLVISIGLCIALVGTGILGAVCFRYTDEDHGVCTSIGHGGVSAMIGLGFPVGFLILLSGIYYAKTSGVNNSYTGILIQDGEYVPPIQIPGQQESSTNPVAL